MRVLFVNPSQVMAYGRIRPPVQIHMGLAYLTAVAEGDGHKISVIDMDAERLSASSFISRLKEEIPDIIGITVTTPALNSSLELARTAKKALPKVKVMLGGVHPSVVPKETIANKEVDFVVKGEGEITLKELLKAIENNMPLKGLKGLLFKEADVIVENDERELIDNLDLLPFPARGIFENIPYKYPDSLYAECAPIITSRGCPGRCTYCNSSSIFGRTFRTRSADNVADEIERLVRDFKIREIHIWDDNFVTKKNRVFQIRDIIATRKIKVKFAFPNGIRADFLDKDIIQALKDMGTYSIAFGVESGNQRVLDMAKKGIRLNIIEKVVQDTKALGIEVWAFFMFGLPGEDLKSAQETIDFAKKLDPDIAKFHILKPYPGTEVHSYLFERHLLESLDYDRYGIHTAPVHHLDTISSEQLLEIQKRAYREFYLRPAKIIHQMLRIKSLNRLVLNAKTAIDVLKLALD
jgi:anaerobic magnesium-protoporphyrin IX monomethyl ester cyclase